ncbi:hypothetical protein DFH07DRAFT_817946 [Mycena maculata]|uniref:CCR4-NOT transcription complex subunit 11 n=1 Tax=Mycena maculata TaxID=230809 RepID=A0AAD7J817_9AGAR|nr:hypothetical protein DFH07DRAFT_817946 [Mycena maculata]
MHSVLFLPGPMSTPEPHFTSQEEARASVSHLLTRASSYPCSAATPAFSRLAQSTSTFQLALDALLPALDPPTPCELTDRILASFILFALYAPHPISINPFKSVLFVTFVKEREKALAVAATNGGVAPNEPLVWVLWKILKGDGDDIGPYSPSALARSLLPPNFRATKLILDETLYHTASDLDDATYSPSPYETHDPTPPRSVPITSDDVNAALAHAMRLLLAARARVLSLAEQRTLAPFLPALASSSLLAPADLAPLVSYNPGLAHPLIAALLSDSNNNTSTSDYHTANHTTAGVLDALARLPPTLPSLDVLGRLLRDPTSTATTMQGAHLTVSALVRGEVLGRFVEGAIGALERAEREQAEMGEGGDRVEKGVQHLCRFYTALIKAGLVDPASDADSAAMAGFSLRYARFGEAMGLYRVLVGGRGPRGVEFS